MLFMLCTFKLWIKTLVSREDLLKVPNRESFDPRFKSYLGSDFGTGAKYCLYYILRLILAIFSFSAHAVCALTDF
jgi:hypothetical protein